MENNVVFAWTVDGGWLYSTSKRRWRLPQWLEAKFQAEEIKDIKCAAFGTTAKSYFISFLDKDSTIKFWTGSDVSPEFRSYLNDAETGKPKRDATLQVVFRPNNSFFAWDRTSMRWSNIPRELESWVQSRLTSTGWKYGPPRLVALGADDAYLAVTTNGAYTYFIPTTWPDLGKDTLIASFEGECNTDKILVSLSNSILSIATNSSIWTAFFSANQVDHYVIIMKGSFDYHFSVPEYKDFLCSAVESLMPEDRQKVLKEAREQKLREEEARKERERRAKQAEEERIRKVLNQHYTSWKIRYEAAMLCHRTLTTFPHLPFAVCTCTNMSCVMFKARDEGLKACQHDAEKLLRASGNYSVDWLRKERKQWHPDKFARHCEPDFRGILARKATEMYAIFEGLIDIERKSA